MKTARRLLLRSGLAALALGSVAAVVPAQSTNPGCARGATRGSLDLPTARQAGEVKGVLFNENGDPRFRLDAALFPTPNPTTRGREGGLRGVLHVLTPGGPRRFARVGGKWEARADGHGRFRARIFRPGPTPTSPVHLLGKMGGRFFDPGPNRTGKYRGRWQMCR